MCLTSLPQQTICDFFTHTDPDPSYQNGMSAAGVMMRSFGSVAAAK